VSTCFEDAQDASQKIPVTQEGLILSHLEKLQSATCKVTAHVPDLQLRSGEAFGSGAIQLQNQGSTLLTTTLQVSFETTNHRLVHCFEGCQTTSPQAS